MRLYMSLSLMSSWLWYNLLDSFGCTPVEAANLAVILPCFYVFMVTTLVVFVLHLFIDDALTLLYRLFKILKAKYQKRKEKEAEA